MSPETYPNGEDPGLDLRVPLARHANKLLRSLRSDETVINLGPDHGDVSINHVRFRDALEEGYLKAYIRQEAEEHKVVLSTVVALGVVAAGIYNLKYRKK